MGVERGNVMIVESLDLVVGAVLLAWGYVMGRGLGIRTGVQRERKKIAKGPELICTCKHGYGTHEHGGKCQGDEKRSVAWDSDGDPKGWRRISCPCLTYDGPQPMPTHEQMIGFNSPPLPPVKEDS
jgi:hypothetical protein